jgi:hypothetical protein
MRLFTCILALVFCSLSCAEEAKAASVTIPDRAHFRLVLLAGQSNMAGRGKVEDQDRKAHPRVVMLSEKGDWVPAIDPVHYDKPGAGVGPGRTFAITLADADPSITIGLIPTACGGSSITTWVPGGFHNQTKSHPYDDCLARTKRAMKDGELMAILWHQGESDGSKDAAEHYHERLLELMTRFRTEFKAPEVPILIGQLGQFPKKPWGETYQQVDAAHQSLVKEMPHVAFVPSDGLTPNPDNVHFNAESQREFGRRYAAAFLTVVSGKSPAKRK